MHRSTCADLAPSIPFSLSLPISPPHLSSSLPPFSSGSLELGEEGSSGGRGAAVMYPPPPNCRIREVHCGSQVRLVVIAIRDITKGEEITVDYSLTEWGDNTMVSNHGDIPVRA